MNHYVVSGRLAFEPELITSASGKVFAKVVIANNENQYGKKVSNFFRCVVFDKLAESLKKYFHKGDGIIISGRLKHDKYEDKNGQQKETIELIIDRWDFPPGQGGQRSSHDEDEGPQSERGYRSPPRTDEETGANRRPSYAPQSGGYKKELPPVDEDLPF